MRKFVRKIVSFIMCLCIMAGLMPTVGVAVLVDGTDESSTGEVYDGIDIQGLMGEGIYFGAFDHVNSTATNSTNTPDDKRTLMYGQRAHTWEGELTPILWIVTQEDSTDDGNLTLYSRYIVDHERYTGFGAPTSSMSSWVGESDWVTSYLNGWLNSEDFYSYTPRNSNVPTTSWNTYVEMPNKLGFLESFKDTSSQIGSTELSAMRKSDVSTVMLWPNGTVVLKSHSGSNNVEWINFFGSGMPVGGATWFPHVQENAYVWIPFGVSSGIYTTTSGVPEAGYANAIPTLGTASLKNGETTVTGRANALITWVRNPMVNNSNICSIRTNIISGSTLSMGHNIMSRETLGVRPIIKLDPTQILMAYEIVDSATLSHQIESDTWGSTWNYAADTAGRTNYKLTLVSSDMELDNLTPGAGMWKTLLEGGSTTMTVDNQDGDYLAYKIVEQDSVTDERRIIAYGDNKGNSNVNELTIVGVRNAVSPGSIPLGEGIYSLYIWTQKEDEAGNGDSSVHSFIGSIPTSYNYPLDSGLSVSYKENSPSGLSDSDVTGMPDDETDIVPNDAIDLSSKTPSLNGYNFVGWNTQEDGNGTSYSAGDTINSLGEDLVLYAQWEEIPVPPTKTREFTVSYFPNGGTGTLNDSKSPYSSGATVIVLNPDGSISREGYIFIGWNTNADGTGDSYAPNDTFRIYSNKTLYAQWREKDDDGDDITPTPPQGQWPLNLDDHFAYMIGYPDGNVRPMGNITREEIATIFFRLLEKETRQDLLASTNFFRDVSDSNWSNTAISTLASVGVIRGYEDGAFDPMGKITRAEFATIAARFDETNIEGLPVFTDTQGHWAEESISRAASLGWVRGYEDGSFQPNEFITRAEAATLINRMLLRLVEDESSLLPDMNVWADNSDTSEWYYLDIQEATNSHDYERIGDSNYESWISMREDPDWKQYEQ